MIISFNHNGQTLYADFSKPIDISIPLRTGDDTVHAFYIPPVRIEPFRAGNFVGDVLQGGSCNVNNVAFNPHGNGTHTETVGHISREKEAIHDCLRRFMFLAKLVSVDPVKSFEDLVITKDQIASRLEGEIPEALIIRTRPNGPNKLHRNYSGSNPVYLEHHAATWLREAGIKHLLLDLPSVDREDDGGKLLAHHAFWNHPESPRRDATITELIYVPEEVKDGLYLLNIQIISIMNDASPSKPILYHLFHQPGRP